MKFNGEVIYIVFHQVLFLISGLCTTLGAQWLFYQGAATGDSYLTQLAQYLGMILVGALIPSLLKSKQKQYQALNQEEIDDEALSVEEQLTRNINNIPKFEEGPVSHKSVIKLACMDIVANFCVTVGRSLSILQWIAIFGTTVGLAVSSMDNFSNTGTSSNNPHATVLMFGTLMTLGGTFGYSCVYVYSDYMMSQYNPPPLPARICSYVGMYTSLLSLVWIGVYTMPQFDKLIHIKEGVSTVTVMYMYILVTISNACHSWNYYELIDRTGSVSLLVYICTGMIYLTIRF
ncbi:hypothetical protein BDF20DRAFT_818337 [Mycotypha africana]|uniref:uncharacterized protein n=1 Tax=Mycotypha africana TaxID=64632 RepID=UPI0022FFF8C5|nr:uncharacterized protein BDF20DRAFT_818337 [Mycotypha africana]KAI8981714.1 hypothetical protein BDF20DRAFT_818337 [Mycotypha africana]